MSFAGSVIRNVLIVIFFTVSAISTALAQGAITAWGSFESEALVSSSISGSDFIAVSAGDELSFLLRSDGSIVSYSQADFGWSYEAPEDPGFISVASGAEYGLA